MFFLSFYVSLPSRHVTSDFNDEMDSCASQVLAIGLSVDYSVHIAHAFMHKQGKRNQRAVKSLAEMGISVINGAVSTFLAVILLSGSSSYIFQVC